MQEGRACGDEEKEGVATAVLCARNLQSWMERAAELHEVLLREGFGVEAVHDFRTALRRCRSMFATLRTLVGGSGWKRAGRLARVVFRALSDLRDTQVQLGWARRLAREGAFAHGLLTLLAEREARGAREAMVALRGFDVAAWRALSVELPEHVATSRLDEGALVAEAEARLGEVVALHEVAMASGEPEALHAVRIGVKKLRYVVENFFPASSGELLCELKRVQDVLGEIHDLDVLAATVRDAANVEGGLDKVACARWVSLIGRRREARRGRYVAWSTHRSTGWGWCRGALLQCGNMRNAD